MPATRRLILIIIVLFLFLLFLAVPGVSWSQTPPPNPWQDPARELAKKIAVISAPRQSLTLTVRNLSSLSENEVPWVRAAIEAELRNTGMGLVEKSNAAEEVRITLSENLQGLLWIAEIAREAARDVAMVSFQKASASESAATEQTYVLLSKLIWEQDDPFLDLAFLGGADSINAKQLILLEPRKLVFFQKVDEAWQIQHALELPTPKVASRDPRAFMLLRDSVLVILPDHVCRAAKESPWTLDCLDREEGLRKFSPADSMAPAIRPVAGKNYLVEKVQNAGDPVPHEDHYYDSIGVLTSGTFLRIIAAIDGKAILSRPDNQNIPTTVISGWGSQLMTLTSECDQSSQLLASGAEDWTETDSLQAFELQGTKPVPASNRILFPGPIRELQSGAMQSVNAIVHNLKTGRYEAYTLTLSCGR